MSNNPAASGQHWQHQRGLGYMPGPFGFWRQIMADDDLTANLDLALECNAILEQLALRRELLRLADRLGYDNQILALAAENGADLTDLDDLTVRLLVEAWRARLAADGGGAV